MHEFYEATGGVTLLVIKHNGSSFDYINGRANNQYFPKWAELLQYMTAGRCYAVACTVKLRNDTVSLNPFGIAFECSPETARALSLEHRAAVEAGTWNAEEEYLALRADCNRFESQWRAQLYKASLARKSLFLNELHTEREAMLCKIKTAAKG